MLRALIAYLAIFLIGCDSIKETLIIGVLEDDPPLSFIDLNAQLVGFEIDLVNEFANKYKKNARFTMCSLKDGMRKLKKGKIDMLLAGASITEYRKEKFDFSTPYNTTDVVCVVAVGSSIKSFEGLARKKIGVLSGSNSESFAKNHITSIAGATFVTGFQDSAIIRVTQIMKMFKQLVKGNIDAFLMDKTTANYLYKTNPIKIIPTPYVNIEQGAMFPKHSVILKDFNNFITLSEENGFLRAIRLKWLE